MKRVAISRRSPIASVRRADQAEFDAERWYRILDQQKVSVRYAAPTAIRMLMKIGASFAKKIRPFQPRLAASVGEPLNPEAVVWGVEALGIPFHDNWSQTETGGIMIANYRAMDVKPGSMGRPLPGINAGIVDRLKNGEVREIARPLSVGELALRPGWPSMIRGYLGDYRKCFAGGGYLTGDLAMRDAEGYYWFVGRADDVIKSAGHLIGPFEVESALMEHPAVSISTGSTSREKPRKHTRLQAAAFALQAPWAGGSSPLDLPCFGRHQGQKTGGYAAQTRVPSYLIACRA